MGGCPGQSHLDYREYEFFKTQKELVLKGFVTGHDLSRAEEIA
jgi:hypothetical protein